MTDTAPGANVNIRPNYADQVQFFNPEANGDAVTVIGCGGIGGTLLPTLATMGYSSFRIWDDDAVEHRNMASTTSFDKGHLFRPKVEVMAERLDALGATDVVARAEKFDSENPEHVESLTGIVISAVDAMSIRQMIWPAIDMNPNVRLFMDGRIGAQQWELIMLEPFDIDRVDWYNQHELFDDAKAADLPCGGRGVTYPSVALSGYIAGNLARFWRGEDLPRKLTGHMGANQLFVQK